MLFQPNAFAKFVQADVAKPRNAPLTALPHMSEGPQPSLPPEHPEVASKCNALYLMFLRPSPGVPTPVLFQPPRPNIRVTHVLLSGAPSCESVCQRAFNRGVQLNPSFSIVRSFKLLASVLSPSCARLII